MAKENPDPNHVHIYERIPHPTRKDLYMCVDNCPHTINAIRLKGKQARCPYCRCVFEIPWNQIVKRRAKLHCVSCTHPTQGMRPGQRRTADVSKSVEEILRGEGL